MLRQMIAITEVLEPVNCGLAFSGLDQAASEEGHLSWKEK